jgi:hypothetical protein
MSVAFQIEGQNQKSQPFARSVNLHILSSDEIDICRQWIVFTSKGEVDFKQLCEEENLKTAMFMVSVKGYNDDRQALIVNTKSNQKRELKIIPEFHASTFIEKALWMTSLAKSIKDDKLASVGVFLKNDLFDIAEKKQLIIEVFRQLTKSTNVSNYYFLVGLQNLETLTNYAFEIKKDLVEENVNLTIFH